MSNPLYNALGGAPQAGLADEWEEADGESFEAVLFKAAEALGVEII